MDKDIVINVEGVSKKFSKSLSKSMVYGLSDIGRNMIGRSSNSGTLRDKEFWALNDISFTVRKGETVGLLGANGSGKTTLLKMLNGIFWPDKGKISLKGRVGALIAVGAGFHPMLTGRENVYLNAAILGMNREEVNRKFDKIIEFADIGDFLDTPVKHYSSGMFVRLGFSVAVHCEPDILLVDEVLSVGDIRFRNKCMAKMKEIRDKGVTIIFVSHNLENVEFLCPRAILIDRGVQLADGDSKPVILQYENLQAKKTHRDQKDYVKARTYNEDGFELVDLLVTDHQDRPIELCDPSQGFRIAVDLKTKLSLKDLLLSIGIINEKREICIWEFMYGENIEGGHRQNGVLRLTIDVPAVPLSGGVYSIKFTSRNRHTNERVLVFKDATQFIVEAKERERGMLSVPLKWKVADQ